MPHLILEHTDNVEFDSRPFFHKLHAAIVDTGAARWKGIKSRAIKLTDYYIADGNPEYKFIHLTIVLREGRPRAVKEEIAQTVMGVLEETFGHYRENGYINISTDMRELEHGIALLNSNIPIVPVDTPSS